MLFRRGHNCSGAGLALDRLSYSEFNTDPIIAKVSPLGFTTHAPLRLQDRIAGFFQDEPLAARTGLVTCLPFMGEYSYRWHHPALRIPELPDVRLDKSDPIALHLEAMLCLTLERLVAEQLGAVHINAMSFSQPVINDTELGGDPETKVWRHILLKVRLPVLDALPIREVLSIRQDLPGAFAKFSFEVSSQFRGCQTTDRDFDDKVEAIGRTIQERATALSEEMKITIQSKYLASRLAFKTATFLLGSGGAFGDFSRTISFLTGGGAIWDLVDLVSTYRSTRLRMRRSSFFFAAELLRRKENVQTMQRRLTTLI